MLPSLSCLEITQQGGNCFYQYGSAHELKELTYLKLCLNGFQESLFISKCSISIIDHIFMCTSFKLNVLLFFAIETPTGQLSPASEVFFIGYCFPSLLDFEFSLEIWYVIRILLCDKEIVKNFNPLVNRCNWSLIRYLLKN